MRRREEIHDQIRRYIPYEMSVRNPERQDLTLELIL